MDYKESVKRSWYMDDLEDCLKMMQALKALPPGLDGNLRYFDNNGDQIATFWLNGEVEQWMVMPTIERS